MTFAEFKNSLQSVTPPAGVSPLLLAMWHDARGDWQKAHEVSQEINTADGARVHAYLHRKEGDLANAAYWYRHARIPLPPVTLTEEWDIIVSEFIDRS
jgi:hypothetical protein